MSFITRILVSIFVACVLMANASADNYCCGNVGYLAVYSMPSNKRLDQVHTFRDPQVCVDIDTGDLVNCQFKFKILGTADVLPTLGYSASGYSENLILGGHYHTAGRPFIYPDNSSGILSIANGTLSSTGTLSITGQTDANYAAVLYPIPEEGGILAVQDDMYAPPGWYCAYWCYTPDDMRDVELYEIGYFDRTYTTTDLVHFPESTDYSIVRDDGVGHQDPATGYSAGTYLTADAFARIYTIAWKYYKATHDKLSLNDMSLPVGGLYDFRDDWMPPHKGHRDGIAVDINLHDGSDNYIDCASRNYYSKILKKIVDSVIKIPAGSSYFTRYLCETNNGDHIHINLFNPYAPPGS